MRGTDGISIGYDEVATHHAGEDREQKVNDRSNGTGHLAVRTFGTLRVTDEFFVIECEPHVSMRLKRVFGKLGTHSFGQHCLRLTKENARDLEWFMERYPLELSHAAKNDLKELSNEHKATEKFIQDIYRSKASLLPFDLAVPAREYQKEAASMWLKCGSILLADDVGLGKTVSAIAGFTDTRTLPAVVVTLAHLPLQWQREINRFAPNLSTHIIKKGTPYKLEVPDVLIMNYHKLAGWAETLAPLVKSVTFDECQELRRSESDKYKAAKFLTSEADFILGLSATPIFNYGGEFFNVLDVLCPGRLGSAEEFHREWCSYGYSGKERIKEPKAFGSYLRDSGLMLRRTRREVKREIPEVSKFHQVIEADTAALDKVSDACAELARLILREGQTVKGEKLRASEELSNILRQATGISKAPYVANFVKMLVDNGEKVVLYGWHRAVYAIWNDLLKDYKPVMFTGSESALQKDKAKLEFVNGDAQILIISLRAGAGLDGLQHACKTVVFGELDWSPGVHEQAIGRVARDGQLDPVMAYFLVSEHGADPTIVDVLGIKKGQIEGVRNHEAPLVEKLQTDPNHIKKLAQSYLNQKFEA